MVTFGMAASMAGVLLQAADTRIMGANAFLLIHEGSLGAIGDFGDVEDRVELMGQMHDRILSLFETRAKPINPKTTKAFIRNRWKRKDWWITAEEAAKLGLVDEVR
jgi:ATP-dependent protease ClpP protease subunit